MNKILIVYYTWSNGNTERIAKEIHSATNADIIKIDTAVPYTGSYDDVVNQGQKEVNIGYKPEIKNIPVNIKDYDTIVLGTPTWWYTMAPAMLTFLTSNDFTGKTIISYQTHGGWKGHTLKDIRDNCRGANFAAEIDIQFDSNGGSTLTTEQSKIDLWINEITKMTK